MFSVAFFKLYSFESGKVPAISSIISACFLSISSINFSSFLILFLNHSLCFSTSEIISVLIFFNSSFFLVWSITVDSPSNKSILAIISLFLIFSPVILSISSLTSIVETSTISSTALILATPNSVTSKSKAVPRTVATVLSEPTSKTASLSLNLIILDQTRPIVTFKLTLVLA